MVDIKNCVEKITIIVTLFCISYQHFRFNHFYTVHTNLIRKIKLKSLFSKTYIFLN